MNYRKIDKYIEIEIDEKFNNKTIEEVFNVYRLSKKHLHELRMSKDVFINELPIYQNFKQILKMNDQFKFPIFIEEEIDFNAQNIKIDIVYEDDFILVINKQPNIDVHPAEKNGLDTLVNGVAYYYQQTHQKCRVRYIHRLDHDTTGAIIFVKNYFVHNLYDYMLSNKEIKRLYIALVKNKPINKTGLIDKPIGRDRHHNQKRIISKTGDDALTKYTVLKNYDDYNMIELELFTGRTHQIRVHMASINCPLLGDELYGERSNLISRQALHAYKVVLIHPITLIPFIIDVPLPNDIKSLLNN
ncbi:MAG: pseudouridine synthase [Haloplasmataceae bacterium]|jgi:23S rRNA pseudouridine1911/1915/1917 synthase|nr:pseudouridine synthase [Haloplasmataceae bacterium]